MLEPLKPQRRLNKRTALFGLLALFLTVTAVDVVTFAGRALHYSRLASEGGIALPPSTQNEAIVVLTGDERRIPKAIELLRLRGSPLLVISGTGKGTTLTDLVNMQGDAVLNAHEVWERIVLEPRSSSTLENALESGKILAERGVKRVILMTSDYHLWRAQHAFKKNLPQYEYILYPVASVLAELSLASLDAWADSWGRLFGEYVKWVFYRWVNLFS